MPTDSPTPREAADRVVARTLGALQAEHATQNAQHVAQGAQLDAIKANTGRLAENSDRVEARETRREERAEEHAAARWAWLRTEWKSLAIGVLLFLALLMPELRPMARSLLGLGVQTATTATTAALPAEPAHLEEAWDEPEAAPEPEPVVLEAEPEPEAATDG